MSDDSIKLEFADDNTAYVTFNRPEVHNAFDAGMIAKLTEICDALSAAVDVPCVVLRGEGKSFSAGADLKWMKESINFTPEQNKADALALARMLYKLDRLPQVTIACVQGAAFGGGLGLVSCCDIVIADVFAKFALSEVKLGLIPATIAPYVINAIGARFARRYFQTGERFGAEDAHKIGLVHEVTDSIDATLEHILQELAKNGGHAMREAKRLCFDVAHQAITPTLMEETASRIANIRTTEDAQTRLKAFLDK